MIMVKKGRPPYKHLLTEIDAHRVLLKLYNEGQIDLLPLNFNYKDTLLKLKYLSTLKTTYPKRLRT